MNFCLMIRQKQVCAYQWFAQLLEIGNMFEQVVFSGGGNRCWWQAGFWDVIRPALDVRPQVIAGVSTGAAMACMLYANHSQWALDYFNFVLKGNPRNCYPGNLLSTQEPVFPHKAIYQQALRETLGGQQFLRLKNIAPEIRIQYTRLPQGMGLWRGLVLGLGAHYLEKNLFNPLHPTYVKKLGFTPEAGRVQDCDTVDDLVSLLMASASMPPQMGVEYRKGQPALDGSLYDNIPINLVRTGENAGLTLVLLTDRFPTLPEQFVVDGRIYAQPSANIPVGAWDYTQPEALRLAYQLGQKDAQHFLQTIQSLQANYTQASTTPAKA